MFSIRATIGVNNIHAQVEGSVQQALAELATYLNISSIEEIEVEKLEVRRYLQNTLSGEEASIIRRRMEKHLFGDTPNDDNLGHFYKKLDSLRASVKG